MRTLLLVVRRYRRTGLTNAPLPATSHTAIRAHCQFFASVVHLKAPSPNGPVSLRSKVFVNVSLPSPQTISPKASGNVHRTLAVAVIVVEDANGTPVASQDEFRKTVAIEIGKNGPAHHADVLKQAAVLRIEPKAPVVVVV